MTIANYGKRNGRGALADVTYITAQLSTADTEGLIAGDHYKIMTIPQGSMGLKGFSSLTAKTGGGSAGGLVLYAEEWLRKVWTYGMSHEDLFLINSEYVMFSTSIGEVIYSRRELSTGWIHHNETALCAPPVEWRASGVRVRGGRAVYVVKWIKLTEESK